jgi:uncharacterized coiled-coil protein SlyX
LIRAMGTLHLQCNFAFKSGIEADIVALEGTPGGRLNGHVVSAVGSVARNAASVLLCAGLCLGPASALAASDDDVAELRRAIEELKAQNRILAKRLATLETDKSQRRPAPAASPAPASSAAQRQPEPRPPIETPPSQIPSQPPKTAATLDLEQRVRELELGKAAQEDAVRSIIGDSLAKVGSKINEYVTFGGALEVTAGHSTDFSGQSTDSVQLSTAELDFEIKVNEWMTGNLIFQYDTGNSVLFPTTSGFNAAVDRVTVDRGTITIGDVQRFPLYVKAGRDVVAFGTSTGVHRADVLSIENPLTIEVFETRRNLIGLGFALPTPAPAPPPRGQVVPPVKPMVLNPLVSKFGSLLGYQPPILRPKAPTPVTPPPEPPPFYGELFVYDANTIEGIHRKFTNSLNARLGYQTSGHCGRPYDQLKAGDLCPWAFDVSVDYLSSVFDSNFLENQYRNFMDQFGTIPGMAVDLKMSFGPVLLIAEYNTAIKKANFFDDAGLLHSISPSAWQVALGYQFDWNPWVEAIGAQGTFVAIGYSRSRDLAGATLTTGVTPTTPAGTPNRVGFVPESRIIVTAAEWVLEGGKIALEYSHNWDYSVAKGGTGRQADGIFLGLTYVW